MVTITKELVASFLPARSADGNKGEFGRALLLCGSYAMPGAACLSASAAARSGAGLVQLAFPERAYPAIAPKLTEQLLLPVRESGGCFCAESLPAVLRAMERADAVLVGCGIGQGEAVCEFVYEVVRSVRVPIVIDADGINAVAYNIDILKEAKAPVILTPHPGEMARLTGIDTHTVQAYREEAARAFASTNEVTLVLKGAGTLVAKGEQVYRNTTGNHGMAKGGSGDFLAGMLVSFLAQGMDAVQAAAAAVYLHGRSGDMAAKDISCRGMLPSDMAYELGVLLKEFE